MKKLFAISTLMLAIAFTSLAGGGLNVGDKAIDFKLKNIDGKNVALTDMKDVKGVIVVFTCNHCPFAKKYETRIVALDKKYKKQGYPVVAINPNDPKEAPEDSYELMQSNAKEKGFTFPYLIDETQDIAKGYGATKTPHVYLLHKEADGTFKVAYIGAIDNDTEGKNVETKYVENAIASLEKGKKPDPDNTKAIGCTIKWKK